MPSPKTLLSWLLGGAVGLGGILQGLHWRSTAPATGDKELEERLRAANAEISMLKRENESLRSLAQGGGEVAVPRELIDRVEKEFGLRFLSSPVVHRIAVEELRDRIGAALESRFGPAGIDDRQEAYRLIGWLRPDDELLPQLTAVRSVGVRGWFDDVSGEAWVTDRFDPESVPDQAALVRLLARILLHQHFPPPPGYPGDDAARAREALHQGAASGAEARFYAAQARMIGFVPTKQNSEVELLLASLPGFIQGLRNFSVTEGKGFADSLYVQGNEALHATLRNPPQTTRSVLFPAESADSPALLEMPVMPEEPYLSESAGLLGLRLWLELAGDAGAAMEISSSWKNDRYLLVPDGEASTAVVWDVELDSKEAVDRLEPIAGDMLAAMAENQKPASAGEVLVMKDGRHLRIARLSPTRLRFLNTATPELAERLK